jgi:hypothetical protein
MRSMMGTISEYMVGNSQYFFQPRQCHLSGRAVMRTIICQLAADPMCKQAPDLRAALVAHMLANPAIIVCYVFLSSHPFPPPPTPITPSGTQHVPAGRASWVPLRVTHCMGWPQCWRHSPPVRAVFVWGGGGGVQSPLYCGVVGSLVGGTLAMAELPPW